MSDRAPFLSPPDSDAALFSRYQTAPDGETFRLLATRHLPLIWSTARRLANGDAALAEDVSQIVLTDFARKAPQLPPGTVAAGWLHRHTCFTARKMVRTEIRRRTREHRAAELHEESDLAHAMTSSAAADSSEPAWPEAAPFLDAALDQLPKTDREAILLRFYRQQDHRSIGTALGFSEEAARKRVARALEKLRTLFRRRGVLLTAALLAQFLTDHATASVPAELTATLPGAAWRQATLGGPIPAASPLTSMIHRFSAPAAAAALVLAGGLWAVAGSGWFSGKNPALFAGSAEPLHSSHQAPAAGPPLLFRCTAANLPAWFLAARLLTYESSPASDEALLAEVRSLAKTGGSVEDFDICTPLGKAGNFRKNKDYEYSPAWSWDEEKEVAVPGSVETRTLGTVMEITATEPPDGGIEITWRFEHQPAEPEFHAWPLSLERSGGDPERSIKMADFHQAAAEGRTGGVMDNEPRLLLIQHLPSSTLPDSEPGPRTVLLFVTLNPS